jgi:uncharacterized protein YceH (UPF0502 family)
MYREDSSQIFPSSISPNLNGCLMTESQLTNAQENGTGTSAPVWSPLNSKQRRVLGVLMEKSKTTPDAYPMTFAGLTTGCNQKTNRAPITNFTADQVEKIVDELRALGALTLVQGNGRVEKVRHYAYQWLGLSKTEAAVMTELLLRGEQTVGELRTRASRMEPIADLAAMSSLIDALVSRNLMVLLSPAGRGQLVSHNLYPEWELTQLQKQVAEGGYSQEDSDDEPTPLVSEAYQRVAPSVVKVATPPSGSSASELKQAFDAIEDLKSHVTRLAARVEHLERELGIESGAAN